MSNDTKNSLHTEMSKFLSFILRHDPKSINLSLDDHGWANIDELITKANESEMVQGLTKELLQAIVTTSDKKRFILSEDGKQIRANQGHSISIDLQLKPTEPPELLYHGTAIRFVESILREGLKSGKRNHVHLSQDMDTAKTVGQRYGKPIILIIKSNLMFRQGFKFYLSENNVWLTDNVPNIYISQ